MVCPLCSSDSTQKRFSLTQENSIFCCKNCELEFLSPQLDDAVLKKLYSESYYTPWGLAGSSENEELKKMKIATFNLRLDLAKTIRSSGNLLDIGCATGYLLEAAKEKGFEPYGVEFSEYSASIANQKFGAERIFNGILEDSKFNSGFFDVISMFDLIEHVRIPQVILEKASSILNKDGVIIISTPDIGSISNKIMGQKWTHYKLEHFYYFNKRSMNLLAKKSNLKVIHYERSKKALNLSYLNSQFKTYKHWLFSPLISIINVITTENFKNKNFYLPIGEMTVMLKKN